MHRIRRNDHDVRVEMTPLMDVIFLLLTFFVYAMVLMVRAELLPVEMQAFGSAQPATPVPAVSITIDRNGALFCNREPILIDDVLARLKQLKADEPETVIYIAAEEQGDTDRLPTFLALYDRLATSGLDISLVGQPVDDRGSTVSEQPAQP